MIETATNARTRDAFHAAHEARAQAMREFWGWLTGPKFPG